MDTSTSQLSFDITPTQFESNDHELEGVKGRMSELIRELSACALDLQTSLVSIPTSSRRMMITETDVSTNQVIVLDEESAIHSLNIYGQIGYQNEQDSREVCRRPGLIQVHTRYRNSVLACIKNYNQVKSAITEYHRDLQTTYTLEDVKKMWQSARRMLCLKQLFRVCQYDEMELAYAGLSVVTKPVVKKLSKKQALEEIKKKKKHIPIGVDVKGYIQYIEEKETDILNMNEEDFHFRVARRGSPRPVVNTRSIMGESRQIMASMPVIIFTSEFVDVSLPRPKRERKRRSDAVLDLSGTFDSGFQIKAIRKRIVD